MSVIKVAKRYVDMKKHVKEDLKTEACMKHNIEEMISDDKRDLKKMDKK